MRYAEQMYTEGYGRMLWPNTQHYFVNEHNHLDRLTKTTEVLGFGEVSFSHDFHLIPPNYKVVTIYNSMDRTKIFFLSLHGLIYIILSIKN
jgi:hypothetical protein